MARHLPTGRVPNCPWTVASKALAAAGLLLIAGCTSTSSNSPPGTSAPSAPTIQAGASPVASPGASPAAVPAVPSVSPSAASPVQISGVRVTPSDATIALQNVSGATIGTPPIDLGGWKLEVGSTSVTLQAGVQVAPGQQVIVHTGPAPGASPSPFTGTQVPAAGQNPPVVRDVYLGPQADVLRQALRPGAHVVLVDPRGVNVSQFDLPRG